MHVRTNIHPRLLLGLGLALVCVPACGGGGGGGGSGSSSQFALVEVSNGFGKLLPYSIALRDAQGQPTGQFTEITRIEQLVDNVTANNPVRPPTQWPAEAKLPNSLEGNHFIVARFTQNVDASTVLSRDTSRAPGSLGAGIQVQIVNPGTGVITPVRGRAFVGGRTFGPGLSTTPGQYQLETWVEASVGSLTATTIGGETPGLGFPGTEPGTAFGGDVELVDPNAFVFVADSDGDLSTHETFPAGQIQMRVTTLVGSTRGKQLEEAGLASSTVGPDTVRPEVQVEVGTLAPLIDPGNAQEDVDPQANIRIQFTEPVQPIPIGDMDDGTTPQLSSSVRVTFGPNTAKVQVPFTVRPISVFDLSLYELEPVYDFPGTGPEVPGASCDTIFGQVDVQVVLGQVKDLALVPNNNGLSPSTFFNTREGPGLVNAPVTPDAIDRKSTRLNSSH